MIILVYKAIYILVCRHTEVKKLLLLARFSGDTCAALDEYRLNPQNSTLSSILPCNERPSDDTILHDAGAEIHDIIDQVLITLNIYLQAYFF